MLQAYRRFASIFSGASQDAEGGSSSPVPLQVAEATLVLLHGQQIFFGHSKAMEEIRYYVVVKLTDT